MVKWSVLKGDLLCQGCYPSFGFTGRTLLTSGKASLYITTKPNSCVSFPTCKIYVVQQTLLRGRWGK